MTVAGIVPLPVRSNGSSSPKSTKSKSSSDSRSENRDSRSRSGNGNGAANRIISTDPRHFAPPFDVISELSNQRDRFIGTEHLTLCHTPSYIRTCLDRVRARVISANRPGLGVTAAACIDHGVDVISRNEYVVRMLEMTMSLHMIENIRADYLQEILGFVQKFDSNVPSSGASSSVRRLNLTLSEGLRARLFDLSSDLGASASYIATLAIMHTMSEQTCVLPEHAAILQEGVDGFVRRMRLRVRMAEGLIAEAMEESLLGETARSRSRSTSPSSSFESPVH